MKKTATGTVANFWPFFSLAYSRTRSALACEPGSGSPCRSIVSASRLKMRSSRPPASARRARYGTSRRQSDDQSSAITRTFAGPPG